MTRHPIDPRHPRVYARVWSSRAVGERRRTWHFEIIDGATGHVILYDNTGYFEPVLRDALIRVEALRHMVIAGHRLKPYRVSTPYKDW